jgi:hypothetical protein
MAVYGYARVSTDGQSLAAQIIELKSAKCEKIFQEKISGARSDRFRWIFFVALRIRKRPSLSGDAGAAPLWSMAELIRKDVEQHVAAHLPADLLAKLRDLHARGMPTARVKPGGDGVPPNTRQKPLRHGDFRTR